MPDHYQTLGLQPWASDQQIRRAYRELSKLYHPDTTQLPTAEATARFQAINTAYGVLSSPERRSYYDRQRQLAQWHHSPTPNNLSTIYNDGLPSDRPLSGGEIFALLLMGATLIGCFALAVVIAYLRTQA
ncbi:MAG: J domain-containing protein [Pseudanabaenaceae cyanobacterium]